MIEKSRLKHAHRLFIAIPYVVIISGMPERQCWEFLEVLHWEETLIDHYHGTVQYCLVPSSSGIRGNQEKIFFSVAQAFNDHKTASDWIGDPPVS